MRLLLKTLSFICIVGGVFVSLYFFKKLSLEYTYKLDKPTLMTETGQVGDFIGGVVGTFFSLGGFLILILTLNEQTKFASKERFESKFFDLLKLHRENIKELETDSKSGRKELHDIFAQFLKCRQESIIFFKRKKEANIYEESYLNELKDSLNVFNSSIDMVSLAKLNIAYLITFYGVGAEGKETVRDQFRGKYKSEFYEPILAFLSMKPIKESKYYKNWKAIHKISSKKTRIKAFEIIRELRNNPNYDCAEYTNVLDKSIRNQYPNNYIKYYGGHQYKLGHYFRHLFQTFTFINEHKKLNKNEKYFYAKTLRAQLSTAEQSLLFVNSISHLGLVWDLNPDIKKLRYDIFYYKKLKNKRLITNYNLITNLPSQSIFGITYRDYYPDVDYEMNYNRIKK